MFCDFVRTSLMDGSLLIFEAFMCSVSILNFLLIAFVRVRSLTCDQKLRPKVTTTAVTSCSWQPSYIIQNLQFYAKLLQYNSNI